MPMETITARSDEELVSRADRLIAELSAALIRVEGDNVAAAVDDALRRAGESLDVDRCLLIECIEHDASVDAVFHWSRPALGVVEGEADVAPFKTLLDGWHGTQDALVFERIPEELPVDVLAAIADDAVPRITMTSAVAIRVVIPGIDGVTCLLLAGLVAEHRRWPEQVVECVRRVAALLAAALARRRGQQALQQSQLEIARLRAQLVDDEDAPQAAVPRASIAGFDDIVGNSPALRTALGLLQEVATTDSTALLLGETGTGKELFARALHMRSARRQFPIISVNCAALPPTLIESELFGHERGAFTDAVAQRQGRFELAHRGTLFLDEIGDLPLELQAKLLRVLQEGEFERVGAARTRKVDVRIVAATHRDLGQAVSAGDFREDLYYRLNVFPIRLPPLRERRDDIPALVWSIIRKRQRAMHRAVTRVSQTVMDALQRHPWPGNIRQLENVVERALIHSTGDTLVLVPDDLEEVETSAVADATSLSSIERSHIEKILRECGWRINGAGNTAERLGMHPNTLRFRMKKLGIVRSRPAAAPPRQPLVRSS
jgi:transcriptional regulator with GAF, ATPase, and Fis domain